MPRYAGIFAGSLVSSRYNFALPTCTCQVRIQSLAPGKSMDRRSHSPFGSRNGLIGNWPGSLNGYSACCCPCASISCRKYPLLVKQADASHRNAEIACRLELIAGNVSQPARINRQRLAQHELHREIGDRR